MARKGVYKRHWQTRSLTPLAVGPNWKAPSLRTSYSRDFTQQAINIRLQSNSTPSRNAQQRLCQKQEKLLFCPQQSDERGEVVHTKQSTFGRSSKIRMMRVDSPERSTIPVIRVVSSLDKKDNLGTFQTDQFDYDFADSHLTDLTYCYCPEIAADIELASMNDTPPNSDSAFGNYLCSLEPIENLPELNRDMLSDAFIELEKCTTLQSATEIEAMECDRPDVKDDNLSPLDSPQLHNIFSSQSFENLANGPEWEEIFSQQDTLIKQLVEIVDNQSGRQACEEKKEKNAKASSTDTTSPTKDCELQSSTTQCNFAEDREKDRRQRNNVASRKSRAMKKERFAAMQSEIDKLRVANRKLKAFVDELDSVIDEARAIVLPPNSPSK
ncbi:protocadherin 11 [Echinococcus multilocularis]|uniref:Protocadherin 11 n=1 Tax=Echinococcus multilocularis TaxID=6211 RepID=A0A068YGZ1_ECHMU|nr:protocadherin 11 [Echinococcus multilocularis]